jgi:hypothetical protein
MNGLELAAGSLMRFYFFFLFSALAMAQIEGRSTVTVGVGGGFPTGGDLTSTNHIPNSAAYSASYEFRLFKYLAPEVGLVNLTPYFPQFQAGNDLIPATRERVTLLSFGLRGILPLKQGRIELLAGVGGAHVFNSGYEDFVYYNASRTIWQINGGGRVAIDHRRRFWVGPTVRFSRDGGRPTQEWLSLTGDFGVRF